MKRIGYFIVLSFFTFNLFAQNSIKDRFSYSIAWTPMNYGINDYGFINRELVNFEAKIHYRIASKFEVSSGVGYQNSHHSGLKEENQSIYDVRNCTNIKKLPIQFNYFLTKEDKNFIPYIKSEFVNEFAKTWIKLYQDDILYDSMSQNYYSLTMDLGLGALIKINNSLSIITEGSYGKDLISHNISGEYLMSHNTGDYFIRLKIGIMFK